MRFGISILACCLIGTEAWAGSFAEALKTGKVAADFRYRVESVDQDGFARDALASTLRSRVGYETGSWEGFRAVVEFEDIRALGDDRFNSTANGRTQFPVVADAPTTEVNRAHLGYSSDHFNVTVGRQRGSFDNQRFLGAVAFRQNEQTFDAARLEVRPIEDVSLNYLYVWQVNRVFGRESPQGRFEGDSHLINAALNRTFGRISAYAYLIDTAPFNPTSNNTFGLRYSGAAAIDDGTKLTYAAEVARQVDASDNPIDYGLNYYLVEVGGSISNASLRAGYEVLEGNGRIGFATPLATLHAFQGFADAFLTTPAAGIEDLYVVAERTWTFTGGIQSLRLAAWYHDFTRERGGGGLGHEFDAVAAVKISDMVAAELKFADFSGASGFPGRRKVWASVSVTF